MKTSEHTRSLDIMRLTLLTEGLDALLSRMAAAGMLASSKPAAAGRSAMIGAGLALESKDALFGTRRDLSAALARGLSLGVALLQALGREGDPALGRALPGGVKSATDRIILADGNVASHIMHAAGFGHAARLKGEPAVSLALFGGAAQTNGELHGALNFAAVYRAQTVFVARGLLGDEVPFEEAAEAWGLPVVTVDGHDAQAVFEAVVAARTRAVNGEGPALIDARVSEVAEVTVDAARLQLAGGWPTDVQVKVRGEVQNALSAAREAAEAAAPVSEETLREAVFEDRPWFL
ncbi:MAG: thiamine pyrophosphate-dependent enzyme [Myxococcota bacterium]